MADCTNTKLLESKKANMSIIGLIAIIGVGAISIGTGVAPAAVIIPEVLKYIALLTGGYVAIQGASDALGKAKQNVVAPTVDTKPPTP